MSRAKKFESVDEYVKALPGSVRPVVERVREIVRKAAPRAVESISYQIPTFKLDGKKLLYFGAWKDHIGFYSIPRGNDALRKELSPYKTEKGALLFPLDKPFPFDLVKKIVKFRMKEI